MFSESHPEDIEFLQNISIKYVAFRVSAQNEISNYIIAMQTLCSNYCILAPFLLTLLNTKKVPQP